MNGLTGSSKWSEEMSEGFRRNIVVRCSLMTAVLFVSQEGNRNIRWRKKEKHFCCCCCWTKWFHQWKIRKTFGNLYISYHPKESPSIIIFLWIVGSKHFRALLQTEVYFDFDDENDVQDNESSLNRPISKEEVLLAFRKLKNKKSSWTRRNNRRNEKKKTR